MKNDRESIKVEVQKIDPDLNPDEDEDAFKVAVVLMAAALVTGPDVVRLATFTKYPAVFVAEIDQRMRAAGLWKDGGVEGGHWFKGDEWRVCSFLADVMVAQGLLLTQRREDGTLEYRVRKPEELQ